MYGDDEYQVDIDARYPMFSDIYTSDRSLAQCAPPQLSVAPMERFVVAAKPVTDAATGSEFMMIIMLYLIIVCITVWARWKIEGLTARIISLEAARNG